tara:strand:- start:903 stop:2012 length:1110 start_codon:yes stop_codon:yes gene_type:complete
MSEITTIVPTASVLSISITHGSTITRGSGVLFYSGSYVLTAAHLFNNYVSGQSINIISANGEILYVAEVIKHHGWDKSNTDFNHDLAIIKLSNPSINNGLTLLFDTEYRGQHFLLTGFGNEGALHTGTNIFDGDASVFNQLLDKNIVANSQVLYDYDNGLEHQNISNNLLNLTSSATPTINETMSKPGDSGGALLLNDKVVAISSYVYRNSSYDVNDISDSSFGELGVATLVNPYNPWIEYVTEGNTIYTIPNIASNVLTSIPEPFGGLVNNYFLLSTTTISSESIRLSYSTRDGTATSGVDYVAKQGWIELLPYETNIAIQVKIYGDTTPEIDETFSVVITDPTNKWLGIGVELIATHTIVNNDIFMM